MTESLNISELVQEAFAHINAKVQMQNNPQAAFEMVFSDNIDDLSQEPLLFEIIGNWLRTTAAEHYEKLFSSFSAQYDRLYESGDDKRVFFSAYLNRLLKKIRANSGRLT